MKKTYIFAIIASLALLFGCSVHGSGGEGTFTEKKVSPAGTQLATKVEMAIPEVDAGEAGNIYLHFEPKDADISVYYDDDFVEFDADAITVEEKDAGKWCTLPFKTKASGSFVLRAKSGDKEWTETVTINPVINRIEIKGKSDPLDANDTVQLSAATTPSGVASNVKWTSSNPEIATVDEKGLVTALKPGKVTITATTKKKPKKESDNNLVSDTFDVTVKGFYLSDTEFYLYTKVAGDEEVVTATTTGYSDCTLEWTSSDTNLFTVVPGTDNKATLKYVENANGDGTLTATLKKTDGTELAKTTAKVCVVKFEMVALGDSIAAGYAAPVMGGQYGHDETLGEADFLEAYNKYLKRRAEGSTDDDYINEYAHPAVIGKYYKDKYNIRTRSYAKSGDQTKDLIEKLGKEFEDAALGTRKGEIAEAVENSNIITLCIGANDILHHAMGVNIVMKSVNEFDKLLADSFESFKVNFDTILQKLTEKNQHVFVMSIYNPYNYFDAEHIPENQRNAEELLGFVKTQKILDVLPVAINYLNQMNAYIKQKAEANDNVHFVDVAACFNALPAAEHSTYVNVDPSKFYLKGLVSTFGKTIPAWFDPHPRKTGQAKIAELFEAEMGD